MQNEFDFEFPVFMDAHDREMKEIYNETHDEKLKTLIRAFYSGQDLNQRERKELAIASYNKSVEVRI